MSMSRWFYHRGVCDYHYCIGECDECDVCMNPEEYGIDEYDEDYEQSIQDLRKGEE